MWSGFGEREREMQERKAERIAATKFGTITLYPYIQLYIYIHINVERVDLGVVRLLN